MDKSTELYERSCQLVPGGVHSPVRSFKGLHRTPVFFERGEGAYLHDCDGKSYIDFCMSFGPLILGHANPELKEKLQEALNRGWSFGACEPYSLELAEFLLEKIPFIDQIRFVNSGTEAVMTALRLARGITGKNKIIKFNGCYHGHTDSMLIKAGSGLAGTSEASSAGVPASIANDTLVCELDDLQELEELFKSNSKDVAALIVEPLPANYGLLPQRREYLQALRELTQKYDSLLIFDEVISGFRFGLQGMAGKTGITPDLITYGKVIGGGMPVGAVAGTKALLERLAPLGPVYQAGTLSANPLAMVAGLESLKHLGPELYANLEKNTQKIKGLFESFLNKNYPDKFNVVSEGSLFWIAPKTEVDQIRSVNNIPADIGERFLPLFEDLLNRGIYLSPNAYEIGFVSTAHDQTVIDDLANKLEI